MGYITDGAIETVQDRRMDVLVTITVLDDEGEELDTVSASAGSPAEAFELALQQLNIDADT